VRQGANGHLARLAGALGRPLAFLIQLVARLSGRRVGVALVYHRIGDPPGDPDRELVPARGTAQFETELRHLERCYRVVPASRLLGAASARRRGQRFPVAITFDDDLDSHAQVAMPILARHGLPATFFVGGASLNGTTTSWWECLQAGFDTGQADKVVAVVAAAETSSETSGPGDIHELARRIQSMGPEQRAAVSAGLRRVAVPEARGLTAAQLRELAARGFDVGFHTRRHDPLPSLRDQQLATALVEGRDEVANVTGREVALIAYPHGKGDGRVAAAARAAGYRLGFTVTAEAAGPATNRFLVPRIGPTIRSSVRGALQIALTLLGFRVGGKRKTEAG
jgi:peptidoglycan/xylan/chitin deacetylase (PgdA/CDA1 family)